ncbi:MAG: caspase family protein [Bacteroidales bacterium]|nr:caspase family protein [Bacteroidales bacterium]
MNYSYMHLFNHASAFSRFLLPVFISLLQTYPVYLQEFTYKEQKEFAGFEDYVLMSGFSTFRNYFAVTVGNNHILIYDRNWNVTYEHKGNPDARAGVFVFSPDEQYMVFTKYKYENDIAVVRLADMKVIQVLNEPKGWINDVKLSDDGKWMAACCQDKLIHVWKWDGKVYHYKYRITDHSRETSAVAFNTGGTLMVTGGNDYKINLYRISDETCTLLQTFTLDEYYSDIAFHPEKELFVVGGRQRLRFYHKQGAEFRMKEDLDFDVNHRISFSPDGKYLAAGISNTLHIFQEKNGSYVEADMIYRHSDHVFGGAFSEDGRFLTSCSSDKSTIIWEVTGITPTNKSKLVEYLGKDLTNAQKQILRPDIVSKIINRANRSLTLPKDEFETSAAYMKRKEMLSDEILGELQKQLEKEYGIKADSRNTVISIPLQDLVSYNADLKIYKIRFMETEAGVDIPIEEARQLKSSHEKALIQANKTPRRDGKSFIYSGYRLQHPNGKTYDVTPVENPFHGKTQNIPGRQYLFDTEPVHEEDRQFAEDLSDHHSLALIFASNVYDTYGELVNPVFDARTIGAELENNYSTYVEIIENPTLNEVASRIREYAKRSYSDNDYLLIFFAGHGTYDEVFKEGYVVFRDSREDDVAKSTYLSHSNLRTMINNIPCKHIMLVMDVCFGGTFDPLIASRSRAADMYADVSNEEYLARKSRYKTRYYLTSGGKEYVPDGRPGQHSPFARKFIEALRNYGGKDNILTVNEILQFIEKVDPQPCFGEFGNNEPGSDFMLIAK